MLSADEVAGARTPGKPSGEIRWHGSQGGRVMLADRQLKVKRPRLRHREEGEVKVPAYEALQDNEGTVRRQLLFPVSDNYFSRSATITSFAKRTSSSTLVLTGAEDKALQGCNLSADSGARPGRGRRSARPAGFEL